MSTVELPVEPVVPVALAVYLSGAPRPHAALADRVRQWLAVVDAPRRELVLRWLDTGRLTLEVVDRDAISLPDAATLTASGLGDAEADRLAGSTHAVLVRAVDPVVPPRPGLLSAWAASRAIAFHEGGLLYDLDSRRFLPLARNADALPDHLVVSDHVVVRAEPDGAGRRLRTVGMGRFGFDELELAHVPEDVAGHLVPVLLAAAQVLADTVMQAQDRHGGQLTALTVPGTIALSPRHAARAMGWPDDDADDVARAELALRHELSGDGSGAVIALSVPARFPGDARTWQLAVAEQVGGALEGIPRPDATDEWTAAHERALAELPAVRSRYEDGLPAGQRLFVKRRFTAPGAAEFLWVAVTAWQDGEVTGRLARPPRTLSGLAAGVEVCFPEGEVFDWMLAGPGRRIEGGHTDVVVRRRGPG